MCAARTPGENDRRPHGDRPGKLLSPARRRAAAAMLRDRCTTASVEPADWSASTVPRNVTSRPRPGLKTASCAGSCAISLAAIRAGATVARTAICARTARLSTASACSAYGARRACECRRRRASAGDRRSRGALAAGRAPQSAVGAGLPVRPDQRRQDAGVGAPARWSRSATSSRVRRGRTRSRNPSTLVSVTSC